MKRKFLVAAVALAPMLAVVAERAEAQVKITTSTSAPIATATAQNGGPADIDIAVGGSIGVTAPGYAVKINSSNAVTNEGAIGFTGVDGATGVLILGGNTGQFTSTGSITVTESYTPTADPNRDGLVNGVWAQGKDRVGIEVTGPGMLTGGITSTGSITVQGNDSQGISVQAPITGALLMETVSATPVTSTTTVAPGTITVTGDNTVGLQVTPTGSVGGNVKITSVTARGVGARGVEINGSVGGALNILGAVSASGYRSTVRSSNPGLSVLYSAQELEQGGAAVTIGGSIDQGMIISAPPATLNAKNLDLDGDGAPDALQGTGTLVSYGAAPALQIGAVAVGGGAAPAILIGKYAIGTPLSPAGQTISGYGLVVQGSVSANGLFDQFTSPFLPAPVSATAIQIGGPILITPPIFTTTGTTTAVTPAVRAPSGSVTIAGGLYNGGAILANAYQADATAIRLGAGASLPAIVNDGIVNAVSTQVNSSLVDIPASGSTPKIAAPTAVNVTAIAIDPGATLTSFSNTSGITAEITGTGGIGGAATAILDRSGTLAAVSNTGSILAVLNQTLARTPLPGTVVAIDLSAGTGPQSISQSVSPNATNSVAYNTTNTYAIGAIVNYQSNIYIATAAAAIGFDPVNNPSLWREIGALVPSMTGDIKFGTGADTLDVEGGGVTSGNSGAGVIAMGGSTNTIIVNTPITKTTIAPTVVTGSFTETAGGRFAINVVSGTLSDTNPNVVDATSVNVGKSGVLLISADPGAKTPTNTEFVTTGASTFDAGAQVGLTLRSVQSAPSETYVVLQTTGAGTLTTATFGTGTLNNAPYLYTATPSVSVANGQLDLTVTRRSTAELGFNRAEGSALDAVLAAISNDANIQKTILAQTTQAGLKSNFDQLLPDQGIGVFETIDAAAQKIAAMTGTTPDAGSRVAGRSLWLQEVNERVDRSVNVASLGSSSKLIGLVGGFEHMGAAGGALGLSLAYMNVQEEDAAAAVGEHVVASVIEAGAYYRRAMGPLSFSARGAGGYAWFSGDRRFIAPGAVNVALSDWGGAFVDGHAQVTYEVGFGRFYARPEISVDYLHLHENARGETGGGPGFDLRVASRSSSRLSGQAIMVLGTQYGKADWLRPEIRAGYREIFSGGVGDTVASFSSGNPFTLGGPKDTGGWMTVGFSIKGGTPYSYVALEGDADFRSGEQRFDLRVSGRSLF